ncbi:hypothetical protein [Neisseria meningitidis]|uniref:hypothetical protein n=1 Tax=Neisseria meningitidis TaxID=487 RepID=UPI0002D900DF|nr:hypothetical protein [Neisseria meningitidis]MCG3364316.1 hypothetical protein [Neisseria meningitidis]MCG3366994.1 hypothetical protein [Neisseria meningitidis]MCL5694517.1 hypothetical protein [Neisseria meningitidis]MCL5707821.1 hypothetical protein [Neisseria meningitidis]MCL5721881.1 hypothetical protein [Neisseria meningitidis]
MSWWEFRGFWGILQRSQTVKLAQKWEQEQKKQQIQQKKETEKSPKHKASRDDWEMER